MQSVHPMVRINYAIRAGSFAYSFAVLALHAWERDFGPIFWLLAAAQFLVYPHLVYLRARRSPNPKHAEETNLFIDAALLGAWIAALQFPLWLAYAAFFSTTLNAAVVRGVAGGLISVGCFAAGAAAWLALGGFGYAPETSAIVTAACFFGSLGYTSWVGYVVHTLRKHLAASRNRLRESEARFRLIAENAADLIAMVDAGGRWRYSSPAYARLLDAEDLREGEDAFRRAHPDDAEAARTAVARAVATGKPRTLTLRLIDREGRVRQLRTHIQSVLQAGVEQAVLVSHDLTDLRSSEERLLLAAHALEGMTEAILITGADGTVVTVNRAFSEITGYSREEALGAPESSIRSALQPASFFEELFETARQEGYWSGTTWSRRKNGSVYREWRSVRAVRGPDGEITHFVTVFYEVNERTGDAAGGASAPGRA